MRDRLTALDWPKVTIEQAGNFYRWKVTPQIPNAPCWNQGLEFSEHLAVTKASNYVRMLCGEEPPTLQELLSC